MARKPTKPRKVVRKKAKIVDPKFNLEVGSSDDPFFVNPTTIPNGVELQWVTTHVNGEPSDRSYFQALMAGWKKVPNQPEVDGQALMWAPKDVVRKLRDADIERARQQMTEGRATFGMDGSQPSPYHGSHFPEIGAISAPYERVPDSAPPVDVEVHVKMRLSSQFQDAANAIGIPLEVYAQRRLDLYLRGSLTGLLMPVTGSAIELLEHGKFEIIPRS